MGGNSNQKWASHCPPIFAAAFVFFQSYFKDRPGLWKQTIAGPIGATSEFWQQMQHHEFVKKHPALKQDHWATTIPIGFHGDGGAFSKQDSLYTFSWNSLLGVGQTIAKRFIFTVIKKSDMVAGTLDAILHVLSRSLIAVLSGTTPFADSAGRRITGGRVDLASGFRGALCQVRGDWKLYTSVFNFPIGTVL